MKRGTRSQEEQTLWERKRIDTYIAEKGITKVEITWKPQESQTGLRMKGY